MTRMTELSEGFQCFKHWPVGCFLRAEGWAAVQEKDDRRRHDRKVDLLTPFFLLIFFAVAECIIAVTLLVARSNEDSRKLAHAIIDGALQREIQQLGDGMVGTARWDDAVAHIYGGLDREWAVTNLTYPRDSFLIDERGRTLWATSNGGKPLDRRLDRMIPDALPALLARLPKTQKDAEARTTGETVLTLYQGRPAIIAAMALAPMHRPRAIPGDDLRSIVFVQPLDDALLSKWQKLFRLGKIRWSPSAGTPQLNTLVLRGADGKDLGALSWPAPAMGRRALRGILPILVVMAVGFVGASAWMLVIIRRSKRRISAGLDETDAALATALENAQEAERAREVAEAAGYAAEQARRDATISARREVEERTRHEAELRQANGRLASGLEEALADMVSETLASASALEESAEATLAMVSHQLKHAAAVRDRSRDASQAAADINHTLRELAISVDVLGKASRSTESAAHDTHDHTVRAREVNGNLLANVELVDRAASLIASISAQTKLLALNASIEAARSGDAGHGFAVVANEVKELARRAHDTTQEIQARVAGISAAAGETVETVDAVSVLVSDLRDSAVDTAATVKQQQSAVHLIEHGSRTVAENTRVADEAISAISLSLDDLARLAADTRQIGRNVRSRAERLDQGFSQIVGQLRAT